MVCWSTSRRFGENALAERTKDTRIIEFEDPDEFKYWMKYFETSKDELLAAISAVGTAAHDVKAHLEEKFAGKA
jgi:hypothetical protein